MSDSHIGGHIEKTIPIEVEVHISPSSEGQVQMEAASKMEQLKTFLASSDKSKDGEKPATSSTAKRQATIHEVLGMIREKEVGNLLRMYSQRSTWEKG